MRRIGLGLLCTSLLLAPAAAPPTRADEPAAAKPASRPATFNDLAIMPLDRIDRVPLGDVLATLKAKQPDFHYLIFRGPNVPADYPVLPPMSLDGVTIRQFLQVVQSECPGVQIRPITNAQRVGEGQSLFTQQGRDVPPGSLMLFDVQPTDEQVQNSGPMAGSSKPDSATDAKPVAATAPAVPEVHVYRVSPIVSLLTMRKAHAEGRLLVTADTAPKDVLDRMRESINDQTKQATNDVLSLLQATLEEANCGPVTLKAHEATQTIVFKGSADAQAVLEKTLETLSPTENEQRQIAEWRSADWLQAEQQVLQQIDSSVTKESHQLRAENAALSKALAEARRGTPTTRPKE